MKKQKIWASFVPMHSPFNNATGEVHTHDVLEMVKNDTEFLDLIMGDENWCFAHDPETKCQSASWCVENSLRIAKLCFQKSKIKKMLILFLNSKGVVQQTFVPLSETVNAKFYLEVGIVCVNKSHTWGLRCGKIKVFFPAQQHTGAHGDNCATVSGQKTGLQSSAISLLLQYEPLLRLLHISETQIKIKEEPLSLSHCRENLVHGDMDVEGYEDRRFFEGYKKALGLGKWVNSRKRRLFRIKITFKNCWLFWGRG